MAKTCTILGSPLAFGAGANWSTGTLTFVTGRAYLIFVDAENTSTIQPTVSSVTVMGNAATIAFPTNSFRDFDPSSSSRRSMFAYKWVGTGGTGDVTVNWGQSNAVTNIIVLELDGDMDVSSAGANLIVQANSGDNQSASTSSATTLSAFANAANATVCFLGMPSTATVTAGTNFTTVGAVTTGSTALRSYAEFYDGVDTTPDWGISPSTGQVGIIAFEIATATGGTALTVSDAQDDHVAENVVLTGDSTFTVANAEHGQVAENVILSTETLLVVANASHGHIADNVILSTLSALTVADAVHSHTAENVVLDVSGAASLAVASAEHAHEVNNVVLNTLSWLTVENALHGHTTQNVALDILEAIEVIAKQRAQARDEAFNRQPSISSQRRAAQLSTRTRH